MDAEDLDSGPLCLHSKYSYPLRSLSNYSAFKSWIIKKKKERKKKLDCRHSPLNPAQVIF